MSKKVLVAMSGGVDSSVSAALLKEQGFNVTGVTMCLGLPEANGQIKCCGAQAIDDARRVCDRLGVRHFVFDYSQEFKQYVINDFIQEYLLARTPNPCVQCNRYLKFGSLLAKAQGLGFDYLATGHYAKISREGKKYFLERPKDRQKDQTYFLYCIKKESLGQILFPLADLDKTQVRDLAKKLKLVVADKPESQDICFVAEKSYKEFVCNFSGMPKPGEIVDLNGKVLGWHKGLINYTIGQRSGLGIAAPQPLYVLALNPETNQVVVGPRAQIVSSQVTITQFNLLVETLPERFSVKIRYSHKPALAKLCEFDRQKLKLMFDQPQEAVTPGQSAVLYQDARVLAGGIML